MVQMDIDIFVYVRAMRELLLKVLSDRKYVDRHMANNVRIRSRTKKLEFNHLKVDIERTNFNTTFITLYKDTIDNYTEGKFKLIKYYFYSLISMMSF